MNSGVLRLRSVTKILPGPRRRELIRSLDLDVAEGEFVAVMGESGAGKSTLLNLIAGLEPPDAGSIQLDGAELVGLDDDALTLLRRARMGFVFQAFHILPNVSVGLNVGLPLVLNGMPPEARLRRVAELLDSVGLADRAGSMPRELSGGELQRVAIARALAIRPRLVLADEPTGNLDADSAAQVLGLFRELVKQAGSMCVMVTHSLSSAAAADRLLVLRGGRVFPADRPA